MTKNKERYNEILSLKDMLEKAKILLSFLKFSVDIILNIRAINSVYVLL